MTRFSLALGVLVAMTLLTLGTGCGVRSGLLRDSASSHEFHYQMDLMEVRHERTVAGQADIGLIFCSIPIASDQYKRAMEELHLKAALNPNEMLVNFREDTGFTTFVGVYCTQQLTISADVVKLTPRGGSTSPSSTPSSTP